MARGNKTERRGRGVPPQYDRRVELRVSSEDLDAWRRAAEEDRRTLSDWLRWLAWERARRVGRE